jgi:uncharacterized protein YecT (DUF1311 family)
MADMEPVGGPSMGSLTDWIHLEAIQALIHHASAVIAAIFLFAITARLIAYLIPDGYAKKFVIVVDDIILLAVFALGGWRLLVYMWTRPDFDEHYVQPTQIAQTRPKTQSDGTDATLAQCQTVAKNRDEMDQCLQRKVDQAERALDNAGVRMKALDKGLATKIVAANGFDDAEQAFLRYREAECRWRGSNAANVYEACIAALSAQRAAEINKFLRK